MGLFSSTNDNKEPARGLTGQCKKCPAKVQAKNGKEASDKQVKHGSAAHGRFVGFRWS